MKKIAPVIVKFILAGFFLYNIGLFSIMKNMEPQKQPPHKADNGQEDRQYLNEKMRHAQNLGENYTPELYFADLAEIRLKEKRNDFDYTAVLSVNFTVTQLWSMFNENIRNCRAHDSEKNYEKLMQRFSLAQKKCLEITEPGHQKREEEFQAEVNRPGYWSGVILGILAWLGKVYLKNFFLAFVLLWVWWYQEKEKLNISNPLSFLICLILYPITIIRIWSRSLRLGMRTWAMEIELKRRQTDIFSMISENEMVDIKRFAASNWKIDKYRDYLENRGLVRQQSLLPIAAITFLFLIIPKTPSLGAVYSSADVIAYHLEIHAPPGINEERLNHYDDQTASPAIISFDRFIFHLFLIWQIIIPLAPQEREGFETNPDPVPLTY